MSLYFEWNHEKAEINLKKHGVTFEEAKSVFYDEWALQFYDENHSDAEERFLMLGCSNKSRVLMICHCYRESETVIRIISARRATKNEAKYYQG